MARDLEKHKASVARWNSNNREKMRAHSKIVNATPERREARRLLKQKIRATPEGKAAKLAEQRAYFATPQGQAVKRAAKARRRARKMAAIVESVSASDIRAVFEAFRNECAYCRAVDDLTLDHFRPLALGGAHAISNLVPACKSCNSAKGPRDPFAFLHDRRLVEAPDLEDRLENY